MSTFLTWLPRILSGIFVLFIASFALDSFAEPVGILHQLGIFALHLVPALAAATCLWIAWRWRILGGLLHIVLCMLFTIFFGSWRDTTSFILISLPLVVAGCLFMVSQWNAPIGKPRQPSHS